MFPGFQQLQRRRQFHHLMFTQAALVPTAAALPHLIPPYLQPPNPGATPPPANVVAKLQPLLPNMPSTIPPQRCSPRNPFPQPKKFALSRPPHLIPPNTPRRPLCHYRHNQLTLIRNRDANAANLSNRFQANATIHPTTGDLQEFRHLIAGPDKATWPQLLENKF